MNDQDLNVLKHYLRAIKTYSEHDTPEFRRYLREAIEDALNLVEKEHEHRLSGNVH